MSSKNHNNNTQRSTGFRAAIPFYILYDLDLNGNHLRFYGQIEQMQSNPDPNVSPKFSYAWMAKQLGISRRNAINIANTLKEKGYIKHIEASPGRWFWTTSTYVAHVGSDLQDHQGSDLQDHQGSDLQDHPKIKEIKSKKINKNNNTVLSGESTAKEMSNDREDKDDSVEDNLPDKEPAAEPEKRGKKYRAKTDYRDDELFMGFYDAYPRREKACRAYKKFIALNPSTEFVQKIIEDVKIRMANNWYGRHKSKIPLPENYLGDKEWEGEIYAAEPTGSSKTKERPSNPFQNMRVK